MPEPSPQAAPIAVYGATGYTGRLVAAELQRRGAQYVLSGRDSAKLEQLAVDLGTTMPVRAVGIDDPEGLRSLLEPCAAVISCAGPFVRVGEPVLAAAAATGTHYVDTTGEQPFIRRAFEGYGATAEAAGAALVSGMGFDYVPGDMLASIVAGSLPDPLDEVTVAYAASGFGASRGTLRSALEMLSGGDVEWRDGKLRAAPRDADRGSFDFGEPIGPRRVMRYPAGEQVTVPRHVRTASVRTLLSVESVLPSRRLAGPILRTMPLTQLLLRPAVARLLDPLIGRLPEGPPEEARRAVRFTVVCEARGDGQVRRGRLSGADIYGFTARSVAHGALLAAEPGFERSGALAPAQAFEPAGFLRAMDLEVDLEPDSAGP